MFALDPKGIPGNIFWTVFAGTDPSIYSMFRAPNGRLFGRPACIMIRIVRHHNATSMKDMTPVFPPAVLDVRPYLANPDIDPGPYDVWGVVVHAGPNTNSGHYWAYVRKNGGWWRCEDSVCIQSQGSLELALRDDLHTLQGTATIVGKDNTLISAVS
jgi:hypothetical protein